MGITPIALIARGLALLNVQPGTNCGCLKPRCVDEVAALEQRVAPRYASSPLFSGLIHGGPWPSRTLSGRAGVCGPSGHAWPLSLGCTVCASTPYAISLYGMVDGCVATGPPSAISVSWRLGSEATPAGPGFSGEADRSNPELVDGGRKGKKRTSKISFRKKGDI